MMHSSNIVFIFLLLLAGHDVISTNDYSSLNCLLEEKHEPCLATKDGKNIYKQYNISLLSPQLLHDFAKLDASFKKAIALQNFSDLEEESFEKIPGGIILSIPVCHLSDINERVFGFLILQWAENEAIYKHVVRALLNSKHVDVLSKMLQKLDFPEDNLKWIAEAVSFSTETQTNHLIHLPTLPLLFYSPPEAIILNNSPERFFFLSLLDDPDDQHYLSTNKPVMRFWSYTMINSKFPESLMNWNNFYIERWGFFLTGGTIEEISQLRKENIDNLSALFSLNFSPLQVRFLFDKFFLNKTMGGDEFHSLSLAITQLLPKQLSFFTIETGKLFSRVKVPFKMSYSSSRQILEIIYASKAYKYKNSSYPFNNFVSALPLDIFQNAISQPLNMSQILNIQSTQLTKSQMFHLSEKHNLFNFKSQDIFKCSEYIKMLPASDIMLNDSPSHVLLHILSKIDSSNIPQTFAVLNKLWPQLSSSSVFKKIMSNTQPRAILDYIPARYFLNNYKKLIEFGNMDYSYKLPYIFISSVSRRLKETANLEYYNTHKPLTFVHTSVTCDDVSLIDPYNFILFLSEYNAYIKLSGKILSKNLQQCCVNKLLEVLQLKSLLIPKLPIGSKLSLLNEAEIDAVGGYILSTLPITSIGNSKHMRFIIKTIGKLGVTELLTAAHLTHLQELSSLLAKTISPTEKISFSLFDFGNLTLFLEPQYISRINKEYFKLLLEGSYIDHRLCAKKSLRSSWYKLITAIFGTPEYWNYQTLMSLGDFMIVVPESDLMKVKDDQWIYAVDNIKTKYYDVDQDSNMKFFEICVKHLNHEEKTSYMEDLRNFIATLVRAAQLQINTVVPAEVLIDRNRKNISGDTFSFMDSNKDIKFSYPSTKVIIGEEPTQKSTEIPTAFEIKYSSAISSATIATNYFHDDSSTTSNEFQIATTIDKKSETIQNDSKKTIQYTMDPNLVLTKISYSTVNKYYEVSESSTSSYSDFENVSEANNYKLSSQTEEVSESTSQKSGSTFFYFPLKNDNKNRVPSTQNIIDPTEESLQEVSKYTLTYNENMSNNSSSKLILDPGIESTTGSTGSSDISTDTMAILYDKLEKMASTVDTASESSSELDDGVTYDKLQEFNSLITESVLYDYEIDKSSTGNAFTYIKEDIEKLTSKNASNPLNPTVNTIQDQNILKSILDNNETLEMLERKKFMGAENINFGLENNIQEHINQMIAGNKSVYTFLPYGSKRKIDTNKFIDLSNNNVENGNADTTKTTEKLQYAKMKSKLHKMKNSYATIRKRSTEEKWSCEAFRMVGIATEIIIDETTVSNLEDRDLINCIDLFGEMNLQKNVQTTIWKRVNKLKDNFVTAGKLISACDLSDIQNKNFSYTNRWSLENIHLFGKFNTNPDVRLHISNKVWNDSEKPFTAELVASLGSLICDLPEINAGIIDPEDLYKTSVVLGKELPCNYTCLSRLAEIAVDKKSFNDPTIWNFEDIHDLGIIVAGLNVSGWKNLILRNNEALKGLSETAYECLPYTYKKMMRRIPIDILPKAISNHFMEYDTHNRLMKFDFYNPETSPKSASIANSSFSYNKYILIICFFIFKI